MSRCSSGNWGSGILQKVQSSLPRLTHGDPGARSAWAPCRPHAKPGHSCLWVSLLTHSPLAYLLKWKPPLEMERSPGMASSRPSPAMCIRDLLGWWEAADSSAGPWPLRPRTPGLHGLSRQRQVPVPDAALWRGLGLSREAPTHARILL